MIEFRNVTKYYDNGVLALDDVSFKIEKGEFVFIVGATGMGKSTLLKLIYREELPTKGEVIVGGVNIARLRPRQVALLRRRLGVIFQDFKLLPNKTVYENVAFALEVMGYSNREIRTRVGKVLDIVGLLHKSNCYPSELSGGEQQRTSIARALVNNPSILIADEPTGNLDMATSWEIMEYFKRINARGTTIVMATHNKEIVNTMRQRVICLYKGRIVKDEYNGSYE
ncbi:cell division ATP-binding protein FtsE [bacterium]|nr:cell division ATP-binding protein FtsE [bacterium]